MIITLQDSYYTEELDDMALFLLVSDMIEEEYMDDEEEVLEDA